MKPHVQMLKAYNIQRSGPGAQPGNLQLKPSEWLLSFMENYKVKKKSNPEEITRN